MSSRLRQTPTARCPWCRGRFTVPALPAPPPQAQMLLCPYCGTSASVSGRPGWGRRAAQALALRLSRLNLRLRRRLWTLGTRHLI